MGVHLETQADVAVLKLRGNFFGDGDTDKLRRTVRELSADGNLALVIDLGAVRRMNSMALGILVGVHTNYTERGGRVILANLDKNLVDLIAVTRLARVFEIGPSLSDALNKFAADR